MFCYFRGKPQEKCPLCQASYFPDYKGNVCNVCKVSWIFLTLIPKVIIDGKVAWFFRGCSLSQIKHYLVSYSYSNTVYYRYLNTDITIKILILVVLNYSAYIHYCLKFLGLSWLKVKRITPLIWPKRRGVCTLNREYAPPICPLPCSFILWLW